MVGAAVVTGALKEVGRPIFFSLLVITVAFLPVFTLEGTEGRLFKPLAYTKTFSMGFAAILSVTLVPAIAALFIRGRIRHEEENPVSRALHRIYTPLFNVALSKPRRVLVIGCVPMLPVRIVQRPRVLQTASPFLPSLLRYSPVTPPAGSISQMWRGALSLWTMSCRELAPMHPLRTAS